MRSIFPPLQLKWNVSESGSSQAMKLFFLALLATGVVLRFIGLDRKVYSYDETITLTRVAGFTRSEAMNQLFNDREIGIQDLQKFQEPNTERTLTATVKSLATEEPHHTPLYFVMARMWAEWFGNSVAATKTLPALLSLLIFPCLYWLCRELFDSLLVPWIAMGLIAVSPFHVLYAQDARPYSLLTLATVLSGGALLRAVRIQTKVAWTVYAAAVAFGLYSHLLFGLVFVGQAIYVIVTERFRASAVSIGYAVSSLAAIVAFVPWLVIVAVNLPVIEKTTSWTVGSLSLSSMVKAWGGDFSRLFVDSGKMGTDLQWNFTFVGLGVFTAVALGVAMYALWFLTRKTPVRVWLFIITLVGVSSLSLVIVDLALGRHLSTTGRYLIPSFLGLQIAISYLFSAKINTAYRSSRGRRVWQQAVIAVALSGVTSCVLMSRTAMWWNHGPGFFYNPLVAVVINRSTLPLIVSDDASRIFSLIHMLNSGARFQLSRDVLPELSYTNRDVFLYARSEALVKALGKRYKLDPVYQAGGFWRVTGQSE